MGPAHKNHPRKRKAFEVKKRTLRAAKFKLEWAPIQVIPVGGVTWDENGYYSGDDIEDENTDVEWISTKSPVRMAKDKGLETESFDCSHHDFLCLHGNKLDDQCSCGFMDAMPCHEAGCGCGGHQEDQVDQEGNTDTDG